MHSAGPKKKLGAKTFTALVAGMAWQGSKHVESEFNWPFFFFFLCIK